MGFTVLSILVASITVVTILGDCGQDELYVIRTASNNGLVLDATDPTLIKLQHFNGFAPQLWKFERGSNVSLFYIVSSYTGNVIDLKKVNNNYFFLFMNERTGSLYQQWVYNLDNGILNIGQGWNMDVYKANFTRNNPVGVYALYNRQINQQFFLEKKN
ncbi:hypothetical protein Zmor_019849 [Zophobas morio]|uniref:Ricin B lectin domain-containing protein n=1 Tax=Zophobas morio TaxID=2755281 RepID=A0AA38I0K8_9CUCU|nr:hypothetical protein Zmor_019849 [Zophobas morio]